LHQPPRPLVCDMVIGWALLVVTILLEILGTVCMKYSHGFSNFVPSLLMFVFYGLSLTSLTFALQTIDVSVAYAIWSGVGTLLIAIIAMFIFHEPFHWLKGVSIILIILGVIGLNLSE
jgi:small multidrug resistance pump